MPTMDAKALQREVDKTRREFLEQRRRLGNVVTDEDLANHLVAHTEEVGAEQTLLRLMREPKAFRVDADSPLLGDQSRAVLHNLLDSVVDAMWDLDLAVSAREKVLCAADPTRKRRYSLNGREFTFDAEKKTMTYVDTPDKVERLHLEEVQQGRGPEPAPKKSKKRGMSL
jgi:hypothetical protein